MKRITIAVFITLFCMMLAPPGIGAETGELSLAEKSAKKVCKRNFSNKECLTMLKLLTSKVKGSTYAERIKSAQTRAATHYTQGEDLLGRAYTIIAQRIEKEVTQRANRKAEQEEAKGKLALVGMILLIGLLIAGLNKLKSADWNTLLEHKLFKKIVTGVIVGIVSSVALYIFAIPKVNIVGALGFCVALAVSFLFG